MSEEVDKAEARAIVLRSDKQAKLCGILKASSKAERRRSGTRVDDGVDAEQRREE